MKRSELIDALVAKHGLARVEVDAAVTVITERITRGLEDGARVRLCDFGSFFGKGYPAYVGRNPRTGATVDVPAKRGIRFKAHRALKNKINETGAP
jgi:integration host factor subunit beta